jgi:hypothetical protein
MIVSCSMSSYLPRFVSLHWQNCCGFTRCSRKQQQLKIVNRKGKKDEVQVCPGRAPVITQYRGMYSYLPWTINQSESEILNSCCKKR